MPWDCYEGFTIGQFVICYRNVTKWCMRGLMLRWRNKPSQQMVLSAPSTSELGITWHASDFTLIYGL
jgi:hypothetical protein